MSGASQFYRRTLPESCIAFSSEEGKAAFREAIKGRYMECYFRMASQFRTQDEPAYCGLTSLVMALNSLQVDPGRVWKGPWRWYHESMLECCVPLEVVKQNGLNLEELRCLAACNGLLVQCTRALQTRSSEQDEEEEIERFRNIVRSCCEVDNKVLVLSYSRRVLGQTGEGHFSPVGGYHPDLDLLLILDTARFKYEPHWVPVSLVWQAMQTVDKSTGLPRGFMVLSRFTVRKPMGIFRIPLFQIGQEKCVPEDLSHFLLQWAAYLAQGSTDDKVRVRIDDQRRKETGQLGELQQCIGFLLDIASSLHAGHSVLTSHVNQGCMRDQSEERACLIRNIVKELNNLDLYGMVSLVLKQFSDRPAFSETVQKIGSGTSESGCCGEHAYNTEYSLLNSLEAAGYVTVFLLACPFKKGDSLAWVDSQLTEGSALHGEIHTLKTQFSIMLDLSM